VGALDNLDYPLGRRGAIFLGMLEAAFGMVLYRFR
jgi:hypothetical protein